MRNRIALWITMTACFVSGVFGEGWVSDACMAQSDFQGFEVKLSPEIAKKPITGRLYIFLTTNAQKPPIQGPNWFGPEPFLALNVQSLEPGKTILVGRGADCFPESIASFPKAKYRVQAILDHDFYYPEPSVGPGNFLSGIVEWDSRNDTQPSIGLTLDQTVPEIQYVDNDRVKFVQRKSELLSQYFSREVIDRAAVILPESYAQQPDRRYPVYYEVTGFGGNLRGMVRGPNRRRVDDGDVEFIRVMLTGECKDGHHVYANSAKNGPRGDVLVQELIPYIDQQFRTIAEPDARFVGGHSSGGWSSLWLQVSYPETFGAVFSSSPDPVDFRDFQGTDLYSKPPQSVYVDAQGNRRPLARQGTKVALWYDDFCKMDQVLGRGGQMRSFDAVFSPLDDQGEPLRCWDPKTGYVNPEVFEHWKQYDISLKIADQWESLQSRLAGKLHVIMGELDTFYLEGATHRMAERLQELHCDAKIEFIPGASHSLPPEARAKLTQWMKAKFLEKYDAQGIRR